MRKGWIVTLFFLWGCSSSDDVNHHRLKAEHLQLNPLISSDERPYIIAEEPTKNTPPKFPWEYGTQHGIPPITKEFFRCQGSPLNQKKITLSDLGDTEELSDCGGYEEHGLPLRDGKEFVQPILINLLNALQEKFSERVVITSGHRCPKHNTYVDPSTFNKTTRHLLGAEVAFYVENFENRPQEVIKSIQEYFAKEDEKKYRQFHRWEKETDVSTKPWYNEEIFIKLYKKEEGRDFDNRHPYPYISVQVRYDRNKHEKISYSWDKANRQFLRK